MPAPAGFKTFVAGAVLSATSDVQVYLMDQVCTVWNDAAARTSGLGSPAEGQISYLKDTDSVEVYDGASWTAVGGSFEWTGSTANGLATYGTSTSVVAESTATYDGTTLTLTQSGGGLKLDGLASADANTLDDYEEGTWTAGFSSDGGSFTVSTSYDTGSYTKVGRVVTISGEFYASATSTPTGNFFVTGLPFAAADLDERSDRTSMPVNALYLSSDAGQGIYGQIIETQSQVRINYGAGGTGIGGHMATLVDTGSVITVGGSYFTAT